ncbi:Peptidase_C39 like family protein [Prauserella aidingensis]|nr:C39 family peptidase [Prauserella aidingensis]MCP2255402.1 Peptidase_C39 like family protein [Prauserella aidingensis]
MKMRKVAVTAGAAVVALGLSAAVPVQVAAVETASVQQQSTSPWLAAQAGEVTLDIDYQVQQTSYWCGPAATRIALSAQGVYRSQADLAAQLGTHTGGTDHISQVTSVMNYWVGGYRTTEMPNDPPTQVQKNRLWNDVVTNINAGQAIVANIVAPPGNQPPGYPPNQTIYHYFTVVGYDDYYGTVQIADPASFSGYQMYWLTFDQFASLIPPKGYSA